MRLLIVVLLLVPLLSCGGRYEPGSVKLRTDLEPPSQEGLGDNYWRMDGETELYYFSQGQGEPVLILHGGPGMPFAKPWPGLNEVDGFQFMYFHQRGSGNSTIPFDHFSSKNYGKNMKEMEAKLGLSVNLADIERIRRLLKVDKLKIIGHSFGGYLAVLYALEFPDNVERLILVEPADMLSFPQEQGGLSAIEQWMDESQREEYRDFMKEYFNYKDFFKKTEEDLVEMNREFGKYYFTAMTNRLPNYELPAEEDEVRNGGFAGHAMFFSQPRKYDWRPFLQEIDIPVQIIRGQNDLFSHVVSQEYHTLLSQSVYTEFEQSSHFPYIEEPERFGRVVENFLKN